MIQCESIGELIFGCRTFNPSHRTNRSATGRNNGGVVAGGRPRGAPAKTTVAAAAFVAAYYGVQPRRWKRRRRPRSRWPMTGNTCTSSICRGDGWLRTATTDGRPSRCSATSWTGRPGSRSSRWPRVPCRRTGRRSRDGPRSIDGVPWTDNGARRNRLGWRTL